MGLFSFLFGRKKKRRRYHIAGDGSYSFDIVGEASYQASLSQICGGPTKDGHSHDCIATIAEEPDNPYDKNAVVVGIEGLVVGYIPKHQAGDYKRALRRAGLSGRHIKVAALIVGGWDRGKKGAGSFGVKLDMEMPPRFEPH